MQITLMRHGEPRLAKSRWISPREMAQWIDRYNRSEVEDKDIPAESIMAAQSASIIVASTASRALSSVRALGEVIHMEDAIFCEAELPFALWRAPSLPPTVWAAIFRILWFSGYARGSDTLGQTRSRAKTAAQRLAALAVNGPVLLVGHGIMNRLIGKELEALGWLACSEPGRQYWSMGIYER